MHSWDISVHALHAQLRRDRFSGLLERSRFQWSKSKASFSRTLWSQTPRTVKAVLGDEVSGFQLVNPVIGSTNS
jgi:hypothetical protein